ncbi:hypothetical protein LCGC14_0665960 [marine sediment metagenome]|uniref:Beta-lactamase-inhibitor-like, PepSY-like n=2 Tax=root TaxID=1 RepID=A0A831QRN7_9FLAO|nr:hypothetical protein [Pricia sp.]HEA21839.1 hypothetical protein [Pricia antarctica]
MKNLALTAVFALATMTAFAQETETMEETPQQEQSAMEDTGDTTMDTVQEGFTEVSMDEVPEPITNAVKENYPNATLDKVHVNEQMQYKLEATMEDGSNATMMMDAEGNAIEK